MYKDIKNPGHKIIEKDDVVFPEIIKDLQEIINYIKENIIKKEEKNNLINLEEEDDDDLSLKMFKQKKGEKDFKIKLGEKRKKPESPANSEYDLSELDKDFHRNNEINKEKEKINKNIQ